MAKHLVSDEARRVQLAERQAQLDQLRKRQNMPMWRRVLRYVLTCLLVALVIAVAVDAISLIGIHSNYSSEESWQAHTQSHPLWFLEGLSLQTVIITLVVGIIFSFVLNMPRKLNRSKAGNGILFFLMGVCGVFMALPLVMIINNALKPLDEIYQYPPKVFVKNPTLENFSDLFVLMNDSWVPFSRYIFNTLIITVGGMVGHVIIASLAAYPLAKHHFPGKALLFGMVVLSMMFSWTVTQIPQYMIISWLGINNTYWALILPSWSFGMGLYLMKQFMEQLPDSLMESARIQGASEWRIFWSIVMPNVKPAWLTLAIFQFQQMWGNTGSLFLRSEELKPIQYALQQITSGGVARAGAAAAVTFIIAAIPIIFFLLCQSNILETMTTSGMKD